MTTPKRKLGCLKIFAGLMAISAIMPLLHQANVRTGKTVSTESGSARPVQSSEPSRQHSDFMSIRAAERQVRSMLRDPDSAQFSDSVVRDGKGPRVVCGYVNSRNGFGGYTGNTMWIVVEDLRQAVINQPGQEHEFARLWNKYCASKR